MTLQGKTALVTGSTSGLGLGIAESLAAAGCRVGLNGFGAAAEIEALEERLRSDYGVPIMHHGANLTKPAEIESLIVSVTQKLGPIDILVNNAGMQFVSPLEDFPAEKWETILALNLSAAFYTTKAVLPGMRERKWGRIVNIASAHGLVASPFKSAYVAAKHGLVGLTKVTALETARDGITCNALCPGFIHTAIVEGQIEEQARATGIPRQKVIEDVILAKHPTKAFVGVGDVAAYVQLPLLRGGRVDHRQRDLDGRWLDGDLAQSGCRGRGAGRGMGSRPRTTAFSGGLPCAARPRTNELSGLPGDLARQGAPVEIDDAGRRLAPVGPVVRPAGLDVLVRDAFSREKLVHLAVLRQQEILRAAGEVNRREGHAGGNLFLDPLEKIVRGIDVLLLRIRPDDVLNDRLDEGRQIGEGLEPAAERAERDEGTGPREVIVKRTVAAHRKSGEHPLGVIDAVHVVDRRDEFVEEELREVRFDLLDLFRIAARLLGER